MSACLRLQFICLDRKPFALRARQILSRLQGVADRPVMFRDSHHLAGALLGASQDLAPNKVNKNNLL
jgi:hypothetical protein